MLKNKFIIIVVGVLLLGTLLKTNAQESRPVLRAVTSQKDVVVGETFSVSIRARTGEAVNAVSGVLRHSSHLEMLSFSREGSIVNFWIKEPQLQNSLVSFEGVILNPGFIGNNGTIVQIRFRAVKEGNASIAFEQGSLLANDGLGTNILGGFENATLKVLPFSGIVVENNTDLEARQESLVPLPVITDYDEIVGTRGFMRVRGKGAPNELTKIRFEDTSFKTLGEQFILWLQPDKEVPVDILVQNDENGIFEFTSSAKLVAGSYNVTPALVDPDAQLEKPGFGVKILVEQSKAVRFLVVFINILLLLVPVALLIIVIYFIFWYSRLRMRIIKHKTELEDQEIHLSEVALQKKTDIIRDTEL